jgi:hypothetical protein
LLLFCSSPFCSILSLSPFFFFSSLSLSATHRSATF